MKDIIRISVIGFCIAGCMAAAMFFSTKATPTPPCPSPEQISWMEFCKHRGYDVQTEDEEIINEFLDTWVGSVEEEQVFNNIPAQEA